MRFISLAETRSTNLEARNLAEAGDLGPLWIRSDIQSEGRGRRGRAWTSHQGNLFCTGLYPHYGAAPDAALLSFVAALAVADLVEIYVPADLVSLKWPNDVHINGAKTSGVLLENGKTGPQAWVAVGIGVNLVSSPDIQDYPTTHVLAHIADANLNSPEPLMTGPGAAMAILASRFDHWQAVLKTRGFDPIRTAWLSRAKNIPGPVQVNLTREEFSGQAVDLGPNGELQVRLDNGTIRDVHAGDVYFGHR